MTSVGGGANDWIAADTDAILAGVGLRAGVAVIAVGAIGFLGIGAGAGRWIADPGQVALVAGGTGVDAFVGASDLPVRTGRAAQGLPRPTGHADHALAVTAGLVALAGMAGFATGLPGIGDSIRRCLCGLFLPIMGVATALPMAFAAVLAASFALPPVGLSETREERGGETGEEGGEGSAPRSGRAQGLDEGIEALGIHGVPFIEYPSL
jgi:hypothetical protein